jgi:immediate early response 3-interacting protein 1
MALSLWDFLLSSLLFINSVAILNEDRFLARSIAPFRFYLNIVLVGWGRVQPDQTGPYGEPAGPSVKKQIITLMSAVRTLLRSKLPILAILLTVFVSSPDYHQSDCSCPPNDLWITAYLYKHQRLYKFETGFRCDSIHRSITKDGHLAGLLKNPKDPWPKFFRQSVEHFANSFVTKEQLINGYDGADLTS